MTHVDAIPDELSSPFRAFLLAASQRRAPRKRRPTKNARKQKRVASANFRAKGAELNVDFGHHLQDVTAFVSAFEAAIQHCQALSVKAVADLCASLVQKAAEDVGWCMHALFSKLLVPVLADMCTEKTWTFGVAMSMVQILSSRTKWPDDDVVRARTLAAFVADRFPVDSQLPTRTWLIARLRLHPFFAFADLMEDVGTGEALRTFVVHSRLPMKRRVVSALIAKAMASERRQRRELLTCAADLIARCKLDRKEFPEVARHKLINWLHYQVHRVPVRIIEDYVVGDTELLAVVVQLLASSDKLPEAAELYRRHSQCAGSLRPETLALLEEVPVSLSAPDRFAPSPDALQLALHESDVEWVDTVDAVQRLETLLRGSHVVGLDLEWASAGPWSDSSLALLQVAIPTRVFLVDLAVAATQVSVGSLLEALLGCDSPLVVGFSFHNDLGELATSPWAAATRDVKGLADLQRLNVGGAQEGLGRMVQRTLQRPLCKAEQRSYWHRRPLRAAQRHYAALDAFVLLQLASTLTGASLKEPEKIASALRELCGLLQKTRAVAGVQVRGHRISQSEVGIA
mmetsp:Transcript_5492/g.15757  ORF Transcript_5492/g.15757 Transcript_5492/m.15757 type:complete len:572 (-) Transcript_5492:211-1926(-)